MEVTVSHYPHPMYHEIMNRAYLCMGYTLKMKISWLMEHECRKRLLGFDDMQ